MPRYSVSAATPAHDIQLGTLVLRLHADQQTGRLPKAWKALDASIACGPVFLEEDEPVLDALQELLEDGGWNIGGEYMLMKMGHQLVVRVWITPSDAEGNGWTPGRRRGGEGRNCFAQSLEAYGRAGMGKMSFCSHWEQEMLDIYASVPSPDQPDLDSDDYDEETRRRLRSFDDIGEAGCPLIKKLFPFQARSIARMILMETQPGSLCDPAMTVMEESGRAGRYFLDQNTYEIRHEAALYELPRGGILAEQMGVGKSLMALALIYATLHQSCTPPSTGPTISNLTADSYDIAGDQARRITAATKRLYLSDTTLIVCPELIFAQWGQEVEKHFMPGSLKVLGINGGTKKIPSVQELRTYDVVFISEERFRREEGKSTSVLLRIRWKRIILDEGHIAGSKWPKAVVLARELSIERRWIVSGTPTDNLQQGGEREVDDTIIEEIPDDDPANPMDNAPDPDAHDSRLWGGRDIAKFGIIVGKYLLADAFRTDDSWARVTMPLRHPGRPAFGAVRRLKELMYSLIVKHKPDVIDDELKIPPCDINYEMLQFTPMQLTTHNALMAMISANVHSSEGTGRDWLLHKKNAEYYATNIANLHLSCFWLGQSGMVGQKQGVKVSFDTTSTQVKDTTLSPDRRARLEEANQYLKDALDTPGWTELMQTSQSVPFEAGGLPLHIRQAWSDSPSHPDTVDAMMLCTLREWNTPGANVPAIQAAGVAHRSAVFRDHNPGQEENRPVGMEVAGGHRRLSSKRSPMHSTPLPSTIDTVSRSSKVNFVMRTILEAHPDDKFVIFGKGRELWRMAEVLEVFRLRYCAVGARGDKEELSDFQRFDIKVCLLNQDSAARGLDLSAANRMILLSPVWNPAQLAQTLTRCHRLSQTRPTRVQVLWIEGSIEASVVRRATGQSTHGEKHYKRAIIENPQFIDTALDPSEIFEIELSPSSTITHIPSDHSSSSPSTASGVASQIISSDDHPASTSQRDSQPSAKEEVEDISDIEMILVKEESDGEDFEILGENPCEPKVTIQKKRKRHAEPPRRLGFGVATGVVSRPSNKRQKTKSR